MTIFDCNLNLTEFCYNNAHLSPALSYILACPWKNGLSESNTFCLFCLWQNWNKEYKTESYFHEQSSHHRIHMRSTRKEGSQWRWCQMWVPDQSEAARADRWTSRLEAVSWDPKAFQGGAASPQGRGGGGGGGGGVGSGDWVIDQKKLTKETKDKISWCKIPGSEDKFIQCSPTRDILRIWGGARGQ